MADHEPQWLCGLKDRSGRTVRIKLRKYGLAGSLPFGAGCVLLEIRRTKSRTDVRTKEGDKIE